MKLETNISPDTQSHIVFNLQLYKGGGSKKIELIRTLTQAYSLSLKDAKDFAEQMIDHASCWAPTGSILYYLNRKCRVPGTSVRSCGVEFSNYPTSEVSACVESTPATEKCPVEKGIVSAIEIALHHKKYEVAAKLNNILILDFLHDE